MSRRILQNLTENINTGVFLDPTNDRIPLWANGRNIVFDKEGPRPVHGFSRLVLDKPTERPIRGMKQQWTGEEQYIFFGTKTNLYKYDHSTSTITNISKSPSVYNGGFWSFAPWGTWTLAVNDTGAVQIYKDSVGNFADLTHDLGGVLSARIVATYKAYAILFGTDDEGRTIRWSDEDDVNVFSPAIANAAGSLYVRDLASPIRAAVKMDQGIVFFGDSTVHILRWTGPPYYFGQFLLSQNAGALGKYSVVNIRNTQFGMGLNGIWQISPGTDAQYIDAPQLHNYVYDDLDFDNAHKSVAWYDEQQDLIIFSYPSKADGIKENSRSVALSARTFAWCPLDFAASAADDSPVFQYSSVGDYRGGVYWHGIPGVGGGLPSDAQAFIFMSDTFKVRNYYGLSGYGKHGYGGPAD